MSASEELIIQDIFPIRMEERQKVHGGLLLAGAVRFWGQAVGVFRCSASRVALPLL